MKAAQQPVRGRVVGALAIVAGALGVCFATPVFAAEDGPARLDVHPRHRMRGSGIRRIGRIGLVGGSVHLYTVRSTTLGSGTIVNEYLSAQGVMFGIAWHGPRVPDLASLLGTYFPQYQQSLKAQRARRP